jgi:hypothetical protein
VHRFELVAKSWMKAASRSNLFSRSLIQDYHNYAIYDKPQMIFIHVSFYLHSIRIGSLVPTVDPHIIERSSYSHHGPNRQVFRFVPSLSIQTKCLFTPGVSSNLSNFRMEKKIVTCIPSSERMSAQTSAKQRTM